MQTRAIRTTEPAVHTKIAYSSRSANAMNVLFNITRQVKVDDVFYLGNIETTRCHLAYINADNNFPQHKNVSVSFTGTLTRQRCIAGSAPGGRHTLHDGLV